MARCIKTKVVSLVASAATVLSACGTEMASDQASRVHGRSGHGVSVLPKQEALVEFLDNFIFQSDLFSKEEIDRNDILAKLELVREDFPSIKCNIEYIDENGALFDCVNHGQFPASRILELFDRSFIVPVALDKFGRNSSQDRSENPDLVVRKLIFEADLKGGGLLKLQLMATAMQPASHANDILSSLTLNKVEEKARREEAIKTIFDFDNGFQMFVENA